MKQLVVNYGTLLAFGAIALDLFFQIQRVWRRKSSGDISLWGYSIRFLSAFVLLAKFATLSDVFLVSGQVLVVVLLAIYFLLIVRYHSSKVRQN